MPIALCGPALQNSPRSACAAVFLAQLSGKPDPAGTTQTPDSTEEQSMTCLRRCRRRLTTNVLMWFAALLLTASASGPYTALLPWARAQGTPANPSAGNSKNPIDQPLAWFYEARKFHQSLGDYTCYLMTRERV